jgi:hypothetical protein
MTLSPNRTPSARERNGEGQVSPICSLYFSKKRLDRGEFVSGQSVNQFLFFWPVGGKYSVGMGQKDDVADPTGDLHRANQNAPSGKVVPTPQLVPSEVPETDDEARLGNGDGPVKIAVGAVTGSVEDTTFFDGLATDDLGHGVVLAGNSWAAKRFASPCLGRCPESNPLPTHRERALLPPDEDALAYPLLLTAPEASLKKNRRYGRRATRTRTQLGTPRRDRWEGRIC